MRGEDKRVGIVCFLKDEKCNGKKERVFFLWEGNLS